MSNNFAEIVQVAKTAYESGFFKGKTPQQIICIMMYAQELGLGPWQCLFGGMSAVQGKIELSAAMMNSLMRKRGHTIEVIESTPERCVLKGTRSDTGGTVQVSFSIDDAKAARIYKPDGPWGTYPQDMCFARAISRLCRRLAPDVIGMSYVEGEMSGIEVVDQYKPAAITHEPVDLKEFVDSGNFDLPNVDRLQEYLEYCQRVAGISDISGWFLDIYTNKREMLIDRMGDWIKKNAKTTE